MRGVMAATAVLLAVPSVALAGDYWTISLADEGMMLADKTSIVATGPDRRQVDAVAVFKVPARQGGVLVDYIRTREEYDCAARRSRTISAESFNADGEKAAGDISAAARWIAAEDDMATREGLKLVCDGGRGLHEGSHFGDFSIAQIVSAYRAFNE